MKNNQSNQVIELSDNDIKQALQFLAEIEKHEKLQQKRALESQTVYTPTFKIHHLCR